MSSALEARVQATARRIAEEGAEIRARVFHMGWWADRMLVWAMSHPAFKTQLFRFVDVFPACRDDEDVLRHLEEYLEGVEMPSALGLGLDAAEHVPFGTRVTASVARRNILRMARQFIAGATPAEAMPQIRALWRQGEAATVDLLGEKTITGPEAARYATRVVEMLEALAQEAATWPDDPHLERDLWGGVPRANVSVKPTALAPLYAPLTRAEGIDQAVERLRPVCRRARELGVQIHLDMEHYDVKDLTLELIRRLGEEFPDGPQLGAVIQAYLKDSYADLRDLVAWSAESLRVPLQIRLVKGAYWDFETVIARSHHWPVPVFERKAETDANYERCVRHLLEHAGSVRPAFGTHNIRTIAFAIESARSLGLHETAYEIQLLYGMAEPVHAALRRMGSRVRAYTAVGQMVPGMAYLVRRLLENTSNESFLRHRFAEGKELDDLVAPPDADPEALPVLPADVVCAPTDPDDPVPFANEAVAEFRRAPARFRMGQAVAEVPSVFPIEAPVMIGGERVGDVGGIVSVDPGDYATVVCRAGRAGRQEADRAIALALEAFEDWSRRPAPERAGVLFRAGAIMRARRAELAALEAFEAGKPWAEADGDVCEAIDFCEFYGREALRLAQGARMLQAPGEANAYLYRPRGVGAVITPWNFPLAIPTGMVVAPLVCGNCVLFKPAEQTPGIAMRLVEILLEAGAPPGAVAFLPGIGEEVGAYLVEHPDVAFVSFTGSKAVGLEIVRRAGVTPPGQRHVKQVVAEMGGKNAIVVDTDADLDVAVPAIVHSAFGYAGQKCSAASRVIAVGNVLDELADRIVGATSLVTIGYAREMSTEVGPVIDEDAWKRLHAYQAVAQEEGDVLMQRSDVPAGGWYVGPTVVATDRLEGRVVTEEIFGPVLALMRAEDFEHAVALANASDYALTGGVFSRSPARIRYAAERFRAGNLYVNRGITGALVGRQPFGGIGLSGVGSKAGGPDYLSRFVEPVVVTENTIRQGFAPVEDGF